MRTILSVALLATAVGVLAVVPGHAAKRGMKNKVVAFAAAQCSPSEMAGCSGPCPRQATAKATAKPANKARAALGAMCPVSDPSACPSSCRPAAATTVAVSATQR